MYVGLLNYPLPPNNSQYLSSLIELTTNHTQLSFSTLSIYFFHLRIAHRDHEGLPWAYN